MVPEFNKKESFQNESCSSETKEFLYDINFVVLELHSAKLGDKASVFPHF